MSEEIQAKHDNHFIVAVEQTTTKHHNGYIYKITFMDFYGKVYESYIDPKNRNFANWESIIAGDKANKGYVLKGLQLRNGNFKQIDADSIPKCEIKFHNKNEMLDIINKELNYDPTKKIFYDLFEIK
jgi:hypothetical protein